MRNQALSFRAVSAIYGTFLMHRPAIGSHDDLEMAADFILDDLPPIGLKVEVVGFVGRTRHLIPFICCWSDDGWVVADTRRKLAFNVEGWRRVGV